MHVGCIFRQSSPQYKTNQLHIASGTKTNESPSHFASDYVLNMIYVYEIQSNKVSGPNTNVVSSNPDKW